MENDRNLHPQGGSSGRSGNDYLQRSGRGHESWAADGPSGVIASGGIAGDGWHSAGASGERSHAAPGGNGHAADQAGESRLGALLAAMGLGAALMYFLDAESGARRRNTLRDQVASAARQAADALRDRSSHARNRAVGAVAEVRGRLGDDDVADEQLVARVRAELGHHVEHMRPIEVTAENGTVTLSGPLPAEEMPAVLAAAEKVRGVQQVENRLEPRAG